MKLLQINTTACDGSDVFWSWFLWLLAAFILGLIIGWILKQISGGVSSSEAYVKQDLTKVEGVGPKIEGLLNKKGIISYRQLSNTSKKFLEDMLVEAGPAFITHRGMTNTWPAQAKLAELGEWDELKKWQDVLKGGV
ncbi:hypothetical protein [Aestuariibaculum suncheonense]|uniref:Helix-hairpin-helix domain-containing protein n=1 Tax=Aestuariibaculum suncheonense TaxID=1028745 RepID=A0A8J6Q7G7_9FLAO|nr:hypothetical protein [Aestuariibaculum suncheonense]MBD0835988.1 hypothetical protein [Aestuariibaculum suncheonense]